MTKHLNADVLICGAGAAGLTLAVDLARRNVSFRLIDKAHEPFRGSRGKGIQPRTQEVFADLGVLDRVVATGGIYPPMRTYHDGGMTERPETHKVTLSEPHMLHLMSPQFLTEAALRERLAELGHAAEYGLELTGFEEGTDSVTATLTAPDGSSQKVSARYLVGADGGRSFVRQELKLEFPGETMEFRGIVADLVVEGLGDDAWHRWNAGDGGGISLCPLRGTDLFQLQGHAPRVGEIDASVAGFNALIAERTGRNDIIVRDVVWHSVYSMNARLADRYRVGRIFLIGDAAHVHPPTGAQGLNTSVQDAYNLGWKLAAVLDGAPDHLLDSYEAERRPVAAGMLGLATKLLSAMRERGDMTRGRETRQMDLGYEGSPLSFEVGRAHGTLRAGDRAPDAPCRGAAGQVIRLFDLFRGPHWTLLGYGVDRSSVTPRRGLRVHATGPYGDIVDDGGHFRDAYGLSPGEWVLVRPDGYIGSIVASGDIKALDAYLDRVGLAAPQRQPEPA